MFDTVVLTEMTAKIAGLDEHLYADQELLDGVKALESARQLIEAAEGSLLAELDARGTTDIVHGHRTGAWLAHECGLAPGSARVRFARNLRLELPGTDAAVREGRLCGDRAKLMLGAVNDRIGWEFRELEAGLIEKSATMTFDEFKRHLEWIVYLLDEDGPEPSDDPANNRLRLKAEGGELQLTGVLVGDLAVTTRAAIEQIADELWRQYRADSERTNGEVAVPARETLLALALAEAVRRGLMVDQEGRATKPKVEATLVFNADQPDVVTVDGKPLVRGSESALMCDLSVWTIVLDSLGVPLDMGREIRTANREQRRALKHRDGGCVFPGCGVKPEHCDAHHVAQWWRDLGTTDVKHMAFLCRHHHGVVHRKGWDIKIGDDGWCWIITPSGISLWCQRHGTIRSGAPPG